MTDVIQRISAILVDHEHRIRELEGEKAGSALGLPAPVLGGLNRAR